MKKRFRETEGWKWVRTLAEFALLALIILALITACEWAFSQVRAEKATETRWVFCRDTLLVREGTKKTFPATGELEPGTMVFTDGKVRNGYIHLIGLANESGDGWARKIYIVDEEPEVLNCRAEVISKGRLAARKSIGGELKKWLKPGSNLTAYIATSEWCITDSGYVMMKYIEIYGE